MQSKDKNINNLKTIQGEMIGFLDGSDGKEPACQCRRQNEMEIQSLDWENPLEEDTAIRSSILTWRIPWTEEPGMLQSTGLQSWT